MEASKEQIKKALVSLAIERTLLSLGTPVLGEVSSTLYKNYKCFLPDCYDHPEYLASILKKLYGNSYSHIIKSISNELEEFVQQPQIENFLRTLSE